MNSTRKFQRLALLTALTLNAGLLTACGSGFKADNLASSSSSVVVLNASNSKTFLQARSAEANKVLNNLMENTTSDGTQEPAPTPTPTPTSTPNPDGSTGTNCQNPVVVPSCPAWETRTPDATGGHAGDYMKGWHWLNNDSFVPGLPWHKMGGSTNTGYGSFIEERLVAAIGRIEKIIAQIEAFDATTMPQEVQDMKQCLLEHFKQVLAKLNERLAQVQAGSPTVEPQYTQQQCDLLKAQVTTSGSPLILNQYLNQFISNRCKNPIP